MWGEKIQIAMPMTVIADTERITALYLAAGSPIKNKSTYRSDHLPIGDWELVDDVWRDDLVRVKYTGDAHAYYAMWKGSRFHRWYINLESAYERTPIGLDFTDRILDIVVLPELAGWAVEGRRRAGTGGWVWDSSRRPRPTPSMLEGKRAIARLEARRSPFADGWEMWTPDPTWPIPSLPSNWDQID